MSQGERARPGNEVPARPGGGLGTQLRRQIRERLQASDALVAALRREVRAWQQQNESLVLERNELLKRLGQADWLHDECLESAARLRDVQDDRERIQLRLSSLEQENADLERRCALLEQTVAARDEELKGAQEEVALLEERVEHLEAIVELLEGHLARQHELPSE